MQNNRFVRGWTRKIQRTNSEHVLTFSRNSKKVESINFFFFFFVTRNVLKTNFSKWLSGIKKKKTRFVPSTERKCKNKYFTKILSHLSNSRWLLRPKTISLQRYFDADVCLESFFAVCKNESSPMNGRKVFRCLRFRRRPECVGVPRQKRVLRRPVLARFLITERRANKTVSNEYGRPVRRSDVVSLLVSLTNRRCYSVIKTVPGVDEHDGPERIARRRRNRCVAKCCLRYTRVSGLYGRRKFAEFTRNTDTVVETRLVRSTRYPDRIRSP